MPETNTEERKAIFEIRSKVFLRGVNYTNSKGDSRDIGFRRDIMNWINSADEVTGHFVLRDSAGAVEEEGNIYAVFYSSSANPRNATCVSVLWQKYVAEGKPSELETITFGYVPVTAPANAW